VKKKIEENEKLNVDLSSTNYEKIAEKLDKHVENCEEEDCEECPVYQAASQEITTIMQGVNEAKDLEKKHYS
jgi:hypothetical protein